MKHVVNNYKSLKTHNIIKKNKLLLIISLSKSKQSSVLTLKQNLIKKKVDIIQLKKTIARKFFTKTIYKKLQTLINGNISLLYPEKKTKNFKTNEFFLIGVILQETIYSTNQIKKLIDFNFKSTVNSLFSLLRIIFFLFFKTLKSFHYSFTLNHKK